MVGRRNTGFSEEVKAVILARSYSSCEVMVDRVCVFTASTIHHRRPRGMGGSKKVDTNDADNGLAVCRVCHAIVESRREWALENGFVVRQGDIPGKVPLWWRCVSHYVDGRRVKRLVLLDKSGKMKEVDGG